LKFIFIKESYKKESWFPQNIKKHKFSVLPILVNVSLTQNLFDGSLVDHVILKTGIMAAEYSALPSFYFNIDSNRKQLF